MNPNGVMFGKNSQVDVGSLTATTAGISNDKFMNNSQWVFDTPGNANSQIINQGSITVR